MVAVMRGGGGEMRSCNLGDDEGWGFGGEISDGNSERERGESWRAVREVFGNGGGTDHGDDTVQDGRV